MWSNLARIVVGKESKAEKPWLSFGGNSFWQDPWVVSQEDNNMLELQLLCLE